MLDRPVRPRWFRAARWLAPALLALTPALASAETIYLKGGEVLHGTVVERPDGKLEVVTKHGSRIVDRADVLKRLGAAPDAKGEPEAATDVVFTTDDLILHGRVTSSEDGKEVIITSEKFGETRIPLSRVKRIRFKDGRTKTADGAEPAPATGEEDTDTRWRKQIEAALGRLRAATSDAKEKARARHEILELGALATRQIHETIASVGSNDPVCGPVLLDALRIADVKSVLATKIETDIPDAAERLIDSDEKVRVDIVKKIVLDHRDEAPPLLVFLIRHDTSSKVKAMCVGQLSFLKRYDELQEVLRLQENGQLRLVVALELGEAGIYSGIPVIIEALKLDGPKFRDIRSTAIEALKRYTGRGNMGYLADTEDPFERNPAVARWEAWWKSEGIAFAGKNGGLDRSDISDADRAAAIDRWRDGNKALDELAKADREGREKNKPLDPKEISYAFETAAYLFRQALDLDPTLSSARISRAILLYEHLGRPREAENELKLVLTRFAPPDAKYLRILATTHLGRLAELEGDWKRSRARYEEVIHLDDASIDGYVGLGDSYLELALASAPEAAPIAPVASPTAPGDAPGSSPEPDPRRNGERESRDELLVKAMNHFKLALGAVEKKQKALLESAADLAGSQTGEVEDFRSGRLKTTIKDDRDGLVKRAASVWFRLGRVQSARGDKKEALAAFRNARSLDPKDTSYSKAAALWEEEHP